MNNKNEKFKRPSLSTATFAPINNQHINNNNNLRRSGYLTSNSTSNSSIIEVGAKEHQSVSNDNFKSSKSGINSSGDTNNIHDNSNNNNNNVSKIKVNDINTVVIDTDLKPRRQSLVASMNRSAEVSGRSVEVSGGSTEVSGKSFEIGGRVLKGRRSTSIPPKEPLQTEVNQAFTDQLMLAKAKLKKKASNSGTDRHDIDDTNDYSEQTNERDVGSAPPPPAPVLPPSTAAKKEVPSTSPIPDAPIPPPAPFLNKPIRHLPPPPVDPREDLLMAIRRAGGVNGLKKTRD